MVIADTSVWIEFLNYREPIFSHFLQFSEKMKIIPLDCVFGELLQGAKAETEIEEILDLWHSGPKLLTSEFWIDAGIFSARHKMADRGVGIIDAVIITAARQQEAQIWTLDKKMMRVLSPHEIFKP